MAAITDLGIIGLRTIEDEGSNQVALGTVYATESEKHIFIPTPLLGISLVKLTSKTTRRVYRGCQTRFYIF